MKYRNKRHTYKNLDIAKKNRTSLWQLNNLVWSFNLKNDRRQKMKKYQATEHGRSEEIDRVSSWKNLYRTNESEWLIEINSV